MLYSLRYKPLDATCLSLGAVQHASLSEPFSALRLVLCSRPLVQVVGCASRLRGRVGAPVAWSSVRIPCGFGELTL